MFIKQLTAINEDPAIKKAAPILLSVASLLIAAAIMKKIAPVVSSSPEKTTSKAETPTSAR
jgi:hypothetical protein